MGRSVTSMGASDRSQSPSRTGTAPTVTKCQNTHLVGHGAGPAPNANHPLGSLLGRSGQQHPSREKTTLAIGPSALRWGTDSPAAHLKLNLNLWASWKPSLMVNGQERTALPYQCSSQVLSLMRHATCVSWRHACSPAPSPYEVAGFNCRHEVCC